MLARCAIATALALGLLAGCSSGGGSSRPDVSDASSPAATGAVASPSASASLTGPIVVEPGTTQVEVALGRVLVFAVEGDPADWLIESSDRSVIAVIQGGIQGGSVMNPGAQALTKGAAIVTLTDIRDIPQPREDWQVSVTVG